MSIRPLKITIEQAIGRLRAARRVLLTTHARADGDAIGSTLALARGLKALGADSRVLLHEGILPRYQPVAGAEPHSCWDAATADQHLAWCDLLVLLDTCAETQLGDVGHAIDKSAVPSLAIDHHVTRDPVVAEAWIDEHAAACAQMIAELFDKAGWQIDSQTATLLFCGIATDTGWFRFSNADHRSYAVAAGLIAAGARPNELYEKLYLNEAPQRARLIGEIMSSFELHAGGRLAVIKITQEMLSRSGASPQMTEDLINEPQRIGSVVACVTITEPAGTEPVRVSFRSKRDIDVAAIAAQFGGGGHERAAGAKLKEPYESACRRVIEVMLRVMK